uniref:Protein kinase domain-containing protein n=1 Tax=Ditylenchus dipsaci TaxID=166011 RepID=A0A915DWV0_9BILA
MSEDEIRFYVANMVMSIQYLQNVQMIHRDLKPANFLFGDDGYLLLADFGLSRPLSRACRAKSFCGTMQYIAPEMIIAYYRNLPTDGYTQAVDWWAVGVMVLEMFTGRSPFKGNGENDLLNNIINQQIYIPKYLSRDAQDFIRRLLNRNPEQRLGYKSGREVKQHPFFKNLDWQQLNTKRSNHRMCL